MSIECEGDDDDGGFLRRLWWFWEVRGGEGVCYGGFWLLGGLKVVVRIGYGG
jgi:hypothetical protein